MRSELSLRTSNLAGRLAPAVRCSGACACSYTCQLNDSFVVVSEDEKFLLNSRQSCRNRVWETCP